MRASILLGSVVLLLLLVVGFFFRGPLPEILLPAEVLVHPFGYPLTNTMVTAWLTIVALLLLGYGATRFSYERMRLVPGRFQNLVEALLEALLNFVVGVAGEHYGRRFFPLVATIFFFVIVNAWLALVPGFGTIGLVHREEHGVSFARVGIAGIPAAFVPLGQQQAEGSEGHSGGPGEHNAGNLTGVLIPILRGANTDLNTTLALALIAMVFVEYWGIRANGFFRYGSRFLNVGRLFRGELFTGIIDVFVGLLETISEMARVVSFTFRLFGNMFAGEVLLVVMTFLVPWVAVLPFYGLELFVGFVQALVFAGLTLVFTTIAVTPHEEHAREEATSH